MGASLLARVPETGIRPELEFKRVDVEGLGERGDGDKNWARSGFSFELGDGVLGDTARSFQLSLCQATCPTEGPQIVGPDGLGRVMRHNAVVVCPERDIVNVACIS
jgi:hypothetical protein